MSKGAPSDLEMTKLEEIFQQLPSCVKINTLPDTRSFENVCAIILFWTSDDLEKRFECHFFFLLHFDIFR